MTEPTDEDKQRQGATSMYFRAPEVTTFRNRPELDLVRQVPNTKQVVNVTQKPVELYRWIYRHFNGAGDKMTVLSVCDGTASAVVAALANGHDAVGVDYSLTQHTYARSRLSQFARLEALRVTMVTGTTDEQVVACKQLCTELGIAGPLSTGSLTQAEVAAKWGSIQVQPSGAAPQGDAAASGLAPGAVAGPGPSGLASAPAAASALRPLAGPKYVAICPHTLSRFTCIYM